MLSPLAQNHWTHPIQATFSHLHSSHNYPTSIPSFSFLFNVLAVLALHPSLFLLGHRHHFLWKLLFALFGMLHRASGIDCLYLFVNLILSISDSPIPSPIISSSSDSPLCLSITPSLSFTLGLKPTCLTNSTPVVSLLPPGLPSRTFARAVSSEILLLFLVFLFFRFCAVR